MHIPLEIKKLPSFGEDLSLPFYATDHSAGMDLVAAFTDPYILQPFERVLVPTGLAFAFPPAYEGQIRPRSGLALKHGITVLNSPGTIDADYRDEIKILLINLGKEEFIISRGLRIAQFVLSPIAKAIPQLVVQLSDSFSSLTPRTGGFGSTGL
jgi:dUTP pyrophosphatase